MDHKRSSEMRGGTWIPLLATVPPSVIVDFVEFELFRAQYRRNEPSSSYDLCRHGKYRKYPTFDKYFSIWLKNLEKKSLHQKLLRATKKRYKHVTTLAACWPSWRPQGWVAVLAQNHDFSNWAGAALSFRQLENAIRTDFQNLFTQNLKLRFFPNFCSGHRWSWTNHSRERLCNVRATI